MKIAPNAAPTIRPDAVARTTGAQAVVGSGAAAPVGSPKGEVKDSVQISDAGRALSAKGASGLSTDRMAQIRSRIQEGAYNSLAVVDEVARRILDHGDA